MTKAYVCKECGDVSEFRSTIQNFGVCEDCLNITVNEKLNEITSRPRQQGIDKAAWVQECNDVLTTHGFDPEYLWCCKCERPTSHVELGVDGVNYPECLDCDFRTVYRMNQVIHFEDVTIGWHRCGNCESRLNTVDSHKSCPICGQKFVVSVLARDLLECRKTLREESDERR